MRWWLALFPAAPVALVLVGCHKYETPADYYTGNLVDRAAHDAVKSTTEDGAGHYFKMRGQWFCAWWTKHGYEFKRAYPAPGGKPTCPSRTKTGETK